MDQQQKQQLATQIAIEQRNAAMNQVIELSVQLQELASQIEELKKPKEEDAVPAAP